MASRPKRRKASRATPTTRSPSIKSGTTPVTPPPVDKEIMLQSCMAQILPTIEDTFRRYMDNFHSHHSRNPSLAPTTDTLSPTVASGSRTQDSSPCLPPFPDIVGRINFR